MTAGCAAGLVAVVRRMATPGPSGGLDLSLPLMALGLALAGLGGLAVVAGSLRRIGGDPAERSGSRDRVRWAAGAGSAIAVLLLAVALAVGVVPSWVVAANTNGTTTDRPGPAGGAPVLTGTVAWSTPARETRPGGDAFAAGADSVRGMLSFDSTRISVLGTAGGLAVLEARGLRMLEAATGAQRWAFHRWDTRHFGPRHRRNSADTGSAAVSPDGRLLAMTVFVDAPRTLLIDNLRASTRVWVFDTISGRRRADFAVPDTARIVGVGGDRVTIDIRPAGNEPGSSGHSTLGMVTFDGETTWRYVLTGRCQPTRVIPEGDDILAVVSCWNASGDSGGPLEPVYRDAAYRVVRLDGGTGRPRWSWQVSRDGAEHVYPERFHRLSVAVTQGMAIVDARRLVGTAGGTTVSHNLVGVRVADGRPVWRIPDQRYGELRTDDPAELGPLHAAAGRAVFAENLSTGTGDRARRWTAVRAIDAQTGKKSWSLDVLDIAVPDLNDSPGPAVLLADGRLLIAYQELTATGQAKRCAMAAWDITTGERHSLIQPSTVPDKFWCFSPQSLQMVEVPGGVAVHSSRQMPGIFVLD